MGSILFFYEGRTIRGLGLMGWALIIQLGAVITIGLALAALALLIGPALLNPTALLAPLLGVLAAVCGIEIGELAMTGVFLAGFYQMHVGRHEYGWAHARSIDRATICLILFATLTAVGDLYTIANDLLLPAAAGVPAGALLEGNLVLAPVAALVAGLALLYSARSLADGAEVRRLHRALYLGIAGSFTGPALLAFATSVNPRDLGAVVSGYLASAVAGNGISALSLLLFVFVLRDIRRHLLEGRPQPVLPRIEQVYPWMWGLPSPAQPPAPQRPSEPPGG